MLTRAAFVSAERVSESASAVQACGTVSTVILRFNDNLVCETEFGFVTSALALVVNAVCC
jgi:hypothetical protein